MTHEKKEGVFFMLFKGKTMRRMAAILFFGLMIGGILPFNIFAADTVSVSEVTETSAVASGTVSIDTDPEGTLYTLDCTKLGDSSPTQSIAITDANFTKHITGLSHSTSYRVVIKASYPDLRTATSLPASFTTLTPPPPPVTAPTVKTGTPAMNNGRISISGTIENDGNATIKERGFVYSTTNPDPKKGDFSIPGSGTSTFTASIDPIELGKVHYVRAYAINDGAGTDVGYGNVETITPPVVITKPTVTMSTPVATAGTLKLTANVSNAGSGTVSKKGFLYSTSSTAKLDGTDASTIVTKHEVTASDFTYTISGITAINQTYYVAAYAENSAGGITYTPKVSAVANQFSATTGTVSSITTTTANVAISVVYHTSSSVAERGVVYSTSPTAELNLSESGTSSAKASTNATGSTTVPITGLRAGTKYYVRAYAKITSSSTPVYGTKTEFTTTGTGTPPTIKTTSASYRRGKIYAVADITSTGTTSVTERGFVYSTSQSTPTVDNATVDRSSSSSNSFSMNISTSSSYTRYYVRAYAKNSSSSTPAYGSTLTVITDVPEVNVESITSISATSANVKINVTDKGGSSVLERGVLYSSSNNDPMLNGTSVKKTTASATTGVVTITITGLTPNTKYYVNSFARNSSGSGYGDVDSFTTSREDSNILSVDVRDISPTGALFVGEITDTSTAITESGVVYGKSNNPTTSSSKIKNSSNSRGQFKLDITGLSIDTTYYARAYAITRNGTTYGDSIKFVTLDSAVADTVRTSDVKQTSVTVSGKITNDTRYAITERGFVYSSQYSDPTIADSKVKDTTSTTGNYSQTITGLKANTKYYVRAYVKTNQGVSYGNVLTFTTIASSVTITVSMKTDSNTTVKTQSITSTTGSVLKASNLSLPAGYSLKDPNWSYNVSSTATITVTVKKAEQAFMSGTGKYFYPDRAATRAEVAQAIYNLAADKTTAGQTRTFSDVPATHPSRAAILYCAAKGYMNGFPDGSFKPDSTTTRAQMATVLCNVYGLEGSATSNFTDVKVNHWGYPFISRAASKGMVGGYPDGSYKPESTTTRAEVCAMFSDAENRTLVPLGGSAFTDVPRTHWAYEIIMNAATPK